MSNIENQMLSQIIFREFRPEVELLIRRYLNEKADSQDLVDELARLKREAARLLTPEQKLWIKNEGLRRYEISEDFEEHA